MGETTTSPDELLERLDALETDVPSGATTTAYADLGTDLNVNAVAIGLGLDDVEYDPETFPGLVYAPDAYEETVVVLFGNGILFVDTAASAGVHALVDHVTDQLEELSLLDGADPTATFSLSPTAVPVPPAYDVANDTAETDESGTEAAVDVCGNCGYDLDGDEKFCPECGIEIRSTCSECGYDLDGDENFCPECGVDLST